MTWFIQQGNHGYTRTSRTRLSVIFLTLLLSWIQVLTEQNYTGNMRLSIRLFASFKQLVDESEEHSLFLTEVLKNVKFDNENAARILS